MRLIDADALKLQFEIYDEDDEVAVWSVENEIEHAPTIEPPKWIPCSERLPENKGKYLTTYHPCYWDDVKDELKIDVDTFQGKTFWAKRKHHRVIAWMELPEPWRGEV